MQAQGDIAAASLVGWWQESGVDTAVSEVPRDWLGRNKVALTPRKAEAVPVEPPTDLPAFHEWLATASGLPMDRAGAVRIAPHGTEGARVMLCPTCLAAKMRRKGGRSAVRPGRWR